MCIPVGMTQYYLHGKEEWFFESEVDYDDES